MENLWIKCDNRHTHIDMCIELTLGHSHYTTKCMHPHPLQCVFSIRSAWGYGLWVSDRQQAKLHPGQFSVAFPKPNKNRGPNYMLHEAPKQKSKQEQPEWKSSIAQKLRSRVGIAAASSPSQIDHPSQTAFFIKLFFCLKPELSKVLFSKKQKHKTCNRKQCWSSLPVQFQYVLRYSNVKHGLFLPVTMCAKPLWNRSLCYKRRRRPE